MNFLFKTVSHPPRLLWIAIILLAGGFLSYAPALPGEPFWDDSFLVGWNPFFRSPLFSFEVFRHWLFPDSIAIYYRPVQNLSYIADYALWRGNPFGYHLTNILLHIVAGWFLFLVLDRLVPKLLPSSFSAPGTNGRWIAFGIATIWVVHPVHNAAVAYISGRADSLAALFALAAWYLVLRFHAGNGSNLAKFGGYCLCGVLALLALCSKEIAITWLILFAIVHCFFIRLSPKPIKLLACLGAVLAAYYVLHSLPGPRQVPEGIPDSFSFRFLLMLRALGDYARLILFPTNLHMCRTVYPEAAYPHLDILEANFAYEYLTVAGVLTLGLLVAGFWQKGNGTSLRRLGVIWFLVGFLPISNLFPLNAQVAEHWIYMPSLGFLLFLAGWILELPAAWNRAGLLVLALSAIALGSQTRLRSHDWTTPVRLYSNTIQRGGEDLRVICNLALTYAKQGENEKAKQMLRRVLKLYPEYPLANLNLGAILMAEGKNQEAEPYLKVSYSSDHSKKVNSGASLGRLYLAAGRTDEGLETIDDAIAEGDAPTKLVSMKAQWLWDTGKREKALALASKYADRFWWDLPAQFFLVKLYSESGQPEEALARLRHAARLDIWNSRPLEQSAAIALRFDRPVEAAELAEAGIRRDPTPGLYRLLGDAYSRLGREEEARRAAAEGTRLKQSHEKIATSPHEDGPLE